MVEPFDFDKAVFLVTPCMNYRDRRDYHALHKKKDPVLAHAIGEWCRDRICTTTFKTLCISAAYNRSQQLLLTARARFSACCLRLLITSNTAVASYSTKSTKFVPRRNP